MMKKIYNSKLFWMILSLILSVAAWMYVTSLESEVYKQTFRGVRVELVGESLLKDNRNMVVTDMSTNTVTVDVAGPRRIVASLSAENLTAQIDVSKLSQSAYASMQYTITYPNRTDTANLTVTRKVPDTVNFTVSKLSSKTIPVRGSFGGSIAEGYTAEQTVFEPSEITVNGPEAYLRNINYAWINFGSAEISSTYSVETGYTLMTEEDVPAKTTGVSCSTDLVKATVPILQTKELKLLVNLIYGSGANENNTKVMVEPETITLAGDSAILNSMNNVPIATIDLSDFNTTFSDTYPVTFDNSLINIEGVTEAKVSVEVIGLETKNYTIKNIQCRGLPEGYEADVVTKYLTVKIRGTQEQLDNLREEDLVAVADFTGYDVIAGMNIINVKIRVDGSLDAGAISGPYSVSVEIRKADK